MNAIEVRDLRFGYGAETVVDIDHLAVPQGECLAVLGPSGCGKSSLLHLLAGLLRPSAGAVRLLDQDLSDLSATALDRFRGQNMGLVLQRFFLIRALSVRDNALLACRLARCDVSTADVDALLDRLNLGAVANQKPHTLSQGQAQRAAIARALVHKPRIVMADEPTSALDDHNASEAIRLLRDAVSETGATLVVVTHDQRIRGTLDRDYDFGATR
ncbi:MAG: ATP-binding cassette domain-containing protein [Pseudomonadota bacterium]